MCTMCVCMYKYVYIASCFSRSSRRCVRRHGASRLCLMHGCASHRRLRQPTPTPNPQPQRPQQHQPPPPKNNTGKTPRAHSRRPLQQQPRRAPLPPTPPHPRPLQGEPTTAGPTLPAPAPAVTKPRPRRSGGEPARPLQRRAPLDGVGHAGGAFAVPGGGRGAVLLWVPGRESGPGVPGGGGDGRVAVGGGAFGA